MMKRFIIVLCSIITGIHSVTCNYDNQQIVKYENISKEDIRNRAKNGVIQVLVQHAEFNFAEPYSTPRQGMSSGTGFFIDEDGYFVTNAHVVDSAISVRVQIPAMGKAWLKARIVSIYPERDLALLQVDVQTLDLIKDKFGSIPVLKLGDSDSVRGLDQAIAIGYPLGQEALKFTNGIVSGRQMINGINMIQIDTPINPGNSGGPFVNAHGEVIGINSMGIRGNSSEVSIQNINFAIPINDLKLVLPLMKKEYLVKRPSLGLFFIKGSTWLTDYLGNPEPGGAYIVEVLRNGPADKAGIQHGDMIYEINGHEFDIYGETAVSWSDGKISISEFIARMGLGEEAHIILYRNGERMELVVPTEYPDFTPIKPVYPWNDIPDYEVFGGMVVMPLTQNHLQLFGNNVSGLHEFVSLHNNADEAVVITHIFGSSELGSLRVVSPGFTIVSVNDMPIYTLDDFREALSLSLETGIVVMRVKDQVAKSSDRIPVILPFDLALRETVELSRIYRYPITDFVKELLEEAA